MWLHAAPVPRSAASHPPPVMGGKVLLHNPVQAAVFARNGHAVATVANGTHLFLNGVHVIAERFELCHNGLVTGPHGLGVGLDGDHRPVALKHGVATAQRVRLATLEVQVRQHERAIRRVTKERIDGYDGVGTISHSAAAPER
eukprot:CAMPEP_0118837088 /NCGR_PEP_ID=MMETSP1162-20130426/61283_1 /TAXON_ID=33656 /ORGANISM="Phaeocystis Sp, Strain CCMP2710" /LENGTH=142 /DNA_ID=CAMNT_0006768951 /DNA_START=20 /DNA_END=449 /DNA_ORIENTATION=+